MTPRAQDDWQLVHDVAHGNPLKHYGDLDLEMSRKKLDQLGPLDI